MEIIRRNLTNYSDPNDPYQSGRSRYEKMAVTVRVDGQTEKSSAIKFAAATLIEDLAKFEPPVTDVVAADITIDTSLPGEVRASWVREDVATTRLPIGWTSDGYGQIPATAA